jgi:hypothetical protein
MNPSYARDCLPKLLGNLDNPLVTLDGPNFSGNLADEARKAFFNQGALMQVQKERDPLLDPHFKERAAAIRAEGQIGYVFMKLMEQSRGV